MIRLYSYLAAAAAGIGFIVSIFLAGRRGANKDNELRDLNEYVQVQERINNAKETTSADAAIKRLRRRGNIRD